MQNLPTYASRQINVAKIILFEGKRARKSKAAAAPKPTMGGAQRPSPNSYVVVSQFRVTSTSIFTWVSYGIKYSVCTSHAIFLLQE